MLQTRIMTGVPVFLIIIAAIYVGNIWFIGGACLFATVAAWEFGKMSKAKGYHPTQIFTLGLVLLIVLDSYYGSQAYTIPGITFILFAALVWQLFNKKSNSPTADWALTIVGGLYIGWGIGTLVALRQLPNGLAWVWLALLPTWGADTLAYLVGRRFGRHKVWPRHSPGKSWEGLGGGIIGGLLAALIIKAIFGTPTWQDTILLGLLVPIVAFFGDVSESMMKRDMGLKDSSNLFPGHGGFLDRMDSVLFVNVLVYYYAWWVG